MYFNAPVLNTLTSYNIWKFWSIVYGCNACCRENTCTLVQLFSQWYFASLRWTSLVSHITLNLKYTTWREELVTSSYPITTPWTSGISMRNTGSSGISPSKKIASQRDESLPIWITVHAWWKHCTHEIQQDLIPKVIRNLVSIYISR